MIDERMVKELNQVKGIIMSYIFVASLITFIVKITMLEQDHFLAIPEGYLMFVSLLGTIFWFMSREKDYDERLVLNFEKAINIFFMCLLIGSLLLNFIMKAVSTEYLFYETSYLTLFIVIAVIIFLYLTSKRNLYLNHKNLDKDHTEYLKGIFVNLLILLGVYVSFAIPYLITGKFNYGWITLLLSYISIAFPYTIYMLYEKSKYEDELLSYDNKFTFIPKSIPILFVPIFAYTVFGGILMIFYYIKIYDFMDTSFLAGTDENIFIFLNDSLFAVYPYTVVLFGLIFYLIYRQIKQRNPDSSSLKVLKPVFIIYVAHNIISYTLSKIQHGLSTYRVRDMHTLMEDGDPWYFVAFEYVHGLYFEFSSYINIACVLLILGILVQRKVKTVWPFVVYISLSFFNFLISHEFRELWIKFLNSLNNHDRLFFFLTSWYGLINTITIVSFCFLFYFLKLKSSEIITKTTEESIESVDLSY